MKQPVFSGSCTAMITPFSPRGIDYDRMNKLLDFQAENGTNAVVIAGTTGEISTLTDREYRTLAAFSVEKAAGRMKVIVCVGGNNTEKCLDNARFAASIGADAVLMTAPYYNKTSEDGLARHFLTVADSTDIPMILYNVPSRTVIGISPQVYRRLALHPNINGVKEASGDFSLVSQLAAECAASLYIWSGNDDQTLPMMALGALGVISVASNLLPGTVAELCALCLRGDFSAAKALHSRCSTLFRALFLEPNPIPVKAALEMYGLDSGILRSPLLPLPEEKRELLRAALSECARSQ